jgi:hypothetical protein
VHDCQHQRWVVDIPWTALAVGAKYLQQLLLEGRCQLLSHPEQRRLWACAAAAAAGAAAALVLRAGVQQEVQQHATCADVAMVNHMV